MKRMTLTASLVGSAAAGLMAVAIAAPAWAQAATYPDGTDCSAIQNDTNRMDCVNQMNESRQIQEPAPVLNPDTPGATSTQVGTPEDNEASEPAGDRASDTLN